MRRLFPDRDAEARLAEQRDRFTSLLDVLGEHVYLAEVLPDGTIREIFQGPGAERLLGGAEADSEMANWDAAIHPDDRAAYVAFNDRLRPRRDADGTLFYDGVSRDVTERRRLEDELLRSARVDALTGVDSRGHFADVAEVRLAGASGDYGLVLLDADHFKQVNDAYGHTVGDAVLIELAVRLSDALAPGDLLGRWGGEEFAVLIGAIGSDAELERRAEDLRRAVADRPIAAGPVEIPQTISVGAVRAAENQRSLDALVEAADRCLYAAKRSGRNRVNLEGSGTFSKRA